MVSQRVDNVLHARSGVRRVLAVRETLDQRLERIVGGAGGLRVALAQILVGEAAEPAQVVVEVDQALEVIGVIDAGVVRVQLDEAIDRSQRGGGFAVLVVGVGGFDLRLLRERAERVAALELLVVLDGLRIVAAVERILRLRI
jgi:hypothetical protein